jgi:hypothetical protein
MAEMPAPWASVVLPVRAMAVVRVPMVRVLTVAVAVRPVRALLPRLRAWPAVTAAPAVPVAMRRVRARPVTVVPVASAVMVTTVPQLWSLVPLVGRAVPVVPAVIRLAGRSVVVAMPVPVVLAVMVPTVRRPLFRERRVVTAVIRVWRVLRAPVSLRVAPVRPRTVVPVVPVVTASPQLML